MISMLQIGVLEIRGLNNNIEITCYYVKNMPLSHRDHVLTIDLKKIYGAISPRLNRNNRAHAVTARTSYVTSRADVGNFLSKKHIFQNRREC